MRNFAGALLLVLLATMVLAQEEGAEAPAADTDAKEADANITQTYEAPRVEGVHFAETFDGDVWSRWTRSKGEKYNGDVKVEKRTAEALVGDVGLLIPDAAKHYGVSAKFAPIEGQKDAPFVAQFEVRFQEGLSCGGSYIKLFDAAGKAADEFDNETPYVIMFGPDKCGGTNKVHFILRHRSPKTGVWEEKHLKDAPAVPSDTLSHLYCLTIRPDNTFDIQIDGTQKTTGDLLTSMEPPVNPPEQIDDVEDHKPETWADEPKMDDPASSKPEDWDEDAPAKIADSTATMPAGWIEDQEKRIPDPSSKRPDDWDDEEDGEWEAPVIDNPVCSVGCGKWTPPMISNPEYKGKWHAPKIDNPDYKGVWKPRLIANPDYFLDDAPGVLPKIDSVGIDIWTMSGGILFDNFVIDSDETRAREFADQSWKIRQGVEELQQKAKESSDSTSQKILGTIQDNLLAFGITVAVLMAASVWFCCLRGDSVPPAPSDGERRTEGGKNGTPEGEQKETKEDTTKKEEKATEEQPTKDD